MFGLPEFIRKCSTWAAPVTSVHSAKHKGGQGHSLGGNGEDNPYEAIN